MRELKPDPTGSRNPGSAAGRPTHRGWIAPASAAATLIFGLWLVRPALALVVGSIGIVAGAGLQLGMWAWRRRPAPSPSARNDRHGHTFVPLVALAAGVAATGLVVSLANQPGEHSGSAVGAAIRTAPPERIPVRFREVVENANGGWRYSRSLSIPHSEISWASALLRLPTDRLQVSTRTFRRLVTSAPSNLETRLTAHRRALFRFDRADYAAQIARWCNARGVCEYLTASQMSQIERGQSVDTLDGDPATDEHVIARAFRTVGLRPSPVDATGSLFVSATRSLAWSTPELRPLTRSFSIPLPHAESLQNVTLVPDRGSEVDLISPTAAVFSVSADVVRTSPAGAGQTRYAISLTNPVGRPARSISVQLLSSFGQTSPGRELASLTVAKGFWAVILAIVTLLSKAAVGAVLAPEKEMVGRAFRQLRRVIEARVRRTVTRTPDQIDPNGPEADRGPGPVPSQT